MSDTEIENAEKNINGFTFHPNYLSREFKAGTANTFTLAADGGSYDKVPADEAVSVDAFRPYFTGSLQSGSRNTRGIERIEFSKNSGSFGVDEKGQGTDGTLSIYPAHKKIVVTSSLKAPADVRIVNLAGITIAAFTIEPGETVETRINLAAVYLVQTTDGRYNRKLSVR